MFGPLSLLDESTEEDKTSNCEIGCLLCEDTFNVELCLPLFLRHLFDVHDLVIECPQYISNFPR